MSTIDLFFCPSCLRRKDVRYRHQTPSGQPICATCQERAEARTRSKVEPPQRREYARTGERYKRGLYPPGWK